MARRRIVKTLRTSVSSDDVSNPAIGTGQECYDGSGPMGLEITLNSSSDVADVHILTGNERYTGWVELPNLPVLGTNGLTQNFVIEESIDGKLVGARIDGITGTVVSVKAFSLVN